MAKQGPGRNERKGITFVEVMQLFPDDAASEAWFAEIRWPDGPICPRCESANVQDGAKHPRMRYHCRACRKYFSVKTGTVMEGSKLGYQVWALAIFILNTGLKGTSSMKLHRDLGVTQKTAWHLAHRIRESYRQDLPPFTGPVEADETFIGGKEGNKHSSKKLRAGRGPVGKTAVAGVKDRATNRVRAAVVPGTDGPTLKGFIAERVNRDAMVYTDEHLGYRGLPNHGAVRHGVGEFVREQAHTNGVESFWSLLKRGYQGTYHQMSPKHLDRYGSEFAGRHNQRSLDTAEQMHSVARGLVGKRLQYRELTA